MDIPGDWSGWVLDASVDESGDWKSWTMDQIALQIDSKNSDKRVYHSLSRSHSEGLKSLERILRELEKLTEETSLMPRLRKLTLPDEVSIAIRGPSKSKNNTSEKKMGNKYLVSLEEIKESVRFRLQGLDFYTPYRSVNLVQPPQLKKLDAQQKEPAYIYFRLQGDQGPLKGRKCTSTKPLSLTGDSTIIDQAIGSDLVLTAEFDELNERTFKEGVAMRKPAEPKRNGALVPDGPVELIGDSAGTGDSA